MRKTSWRIAQAVLGAALLFFIWREVVDNWSQVKSTPIEWHINWGWIVASLLVTWLMYGFLIWGWRLVLHGWRQRLRAMDAARIWTISSLGKYIPGKVWAIASMVVMSERQGVSGIAATGSAVIMQLISLATGAVIALALLPMDLLDRVRGGSVGAMVVAGFALLCVLGLASPSVTRRIGFLLGRPDAIQPVDPGALAGAVFANLVAWAGYGFAFQLLVRGTMPAVDLSWADATGAFAASYISGYLFLFLPGGIGVREGFIVLLLKDTIGYGPAVALAALSRVTLTVNEIGAAVPFLLMRRPRLEAPGTTLSP